MLLPSLSNPIFADAAEGIQESAQAAGYSVFITCNNYDPAAEQRAVDTMLEQRVEAMILTVADAEQNDQLNRLERERITHVLIFNPASPSARNVVTVDNEGAGRLVGEEFTPTWPSTSWHDCWSIRCVRPLEGSLSRILQGGRGSRRRQARTDRSGLC